MRLPLAARRGSPRRPALVPGLRRLLVAEVVSTTGSQLTVVALSWFVLTTTRSPARSGLVMAAEVAPVVLFGFASGGWARRAGPKRWMVGADLARVPLVGAVPVLAWAGLLPFPLLLALVFAVGVFATPYTASQQMIVAELVCRDGHGDDEAALAGATSTLQSATRLTLLLGPPAAGALIAALGAPTVLLIDAASYLLVAPLVAGLPTRGTGAAPDPVGPAPDVSAHGRRSGPGVLAGVAAVYRDRLLGTWTTASFFSETSYQGLFVAIPVLALFRYDAQATLAGILLAAFGAGALAGSLLARRLTRTVAARRVATVGKTASAVAFAALIPAWPIPVLVAVIAAAGVANGLTNGPVAAIRITRLAPDDRAGGLTAITTLTWVGGFIGLAGAGPALQATSAITVFTVLAALQLLSAVLFAHGTRYARWAEQCSQDPPPSTR